MRDIGITCRPAVATDVVAALIKIYRFRNKHVCVCVCVYLRIGSGINDGGDKYWLSWQQFDILLKVLSIAWTNEVNKKEKRREQERKKQYLEGK